MNTFNRKWLILRTRRLSRCTYYCKRKKFAEDCEGASKKRF